MSLARPQACPLLITLKPVVSGHRVRFPPASFADSGYQHSLCRFYMGVLSGSYGSPLVDDLALNFKDSAYLSLKKYWLAKVSTAPLA